MVLRPAAWSEIGASDVVIEWITDGVPIPFSSEPEPKVFSNPRFTDTEVDFLNNELINLESRGVVQRVSETPHCVSPLKVVPKPSGKFRLICDLRYVNSHCDTPRFSSEGIDVLPEIVRDAEQAVTLDLRDGFFHFQIEPQYRKYLGFQYGGSWWVWSNCIVGLICMSCGHHVALRSRFGCWLNPRRGRPFPQTLGRSCTAAGSCVSPDRRDLGAP